MEYSRRTLVRLYRAGAPNWPFPLRPPSLYPRPCDRRRYLRRLPSLPLEARLMPRALGIFVSLVLTSTVFADAPPAASAKTKVAAAVNGRPITEAAVERALKPVAPESRAKARPEVINFLVENALVDLYLELLKVAVESKEVDAQIDSFKK